jgi:histidinol-phosphate aminotransferase
MSVIKKHITALSAYKPPLEGRNPDMYTLLDFNERTIPVTQPVKQALHRYIDSDHLQMYPAYGGIVDRLAHYAGVSSRQLMITNGSDQGIDLVFRAVATLGAEAIIPGPSFAMYMQCASVENMVVKEPLYTKKGGYPLDEVLAAITPLTRIVVIANPNNPCGTVVDGESIKQIAMAAPNAAILVDECYFEYSKCSVVGYLDDLPNLFVTRTFSKTWGIPSLRFGYVMSAPDNIRALCSIRGPYDVNQMAVVAANAALDYPEEIQAYVVQVMTEAKPLLERWLSEVGIDYWSSGANYLWCFPSSPEHVATALHQQGFLVRPKAYGDDLGLRVTVGTVEQMQRLMQAWGSLLNADTN